MFTHHGPLRFLKKFQSFIFRYTKIPILHNKSISNTLHTLHHPKRKTPSKQINQKISKKPSKNKDADSSNIVYMRETIRQISNILRYSTWDIAEEELQNLPIKWDSYTVNQVLKTHPPMEKAWLFFNWANKLKAFKHDQFTYTTMMDIFGEAKRISSMRYVFEQMKQKGIKIDVVTYTSLMHWLSNDGDVDSAVKLWEEMQDKGCTPTVVSYTAYMKVLFDHNRVKAAIGVYKEMIKVGCSPNCHTYTILMEHLADSGKFSELLEIFSKMQEAGVQPDKATCNILVEKCSKAGETWAMKEILKYMKQNSIVLRYPVYEGALKTLVNAGESDCLLRQVNRHFSTKNLNAQTQSIDEMSSEVKTTSNAGIILNLLNMKNLDAVDHMLTDMMNKSIKLDCRMVSTIIEVNVASSRHIGTLLAFEYSVKLGIRIHSSAYLALIGMFIRKNLFPKVVEIVENMVREGLSLGTQLSALLIYRLGCARDATAAATVFRLLPDEQQNTAAYTALIGALFASGDADKALETFETMKRQGIKVALGTYCVLVAGLEKRGSARELESFRKEKKVLQAEYHSHVISADEKICNLLFAGNMVV